jgi:hypothetical protein
MKRKDQQQQLVASIQLDSNSADSIAEAALARFEEIARLRAELAEARQIIGKFLDYFGRPVGINLKELGHDAYADHKVRFRVGDLIDAGAFLNKGNDNV